jgi:hypothetical protein
MTMKLVINRRFGGFGLSVRAAELYLRKHGKEAYFFVSVYANDNVTTKPVTAEEAEKSSFWYCYTSPEPNDDTYFSDLNIERFDKTLVEVVSELGELANGRHAKLEIVEIPDTASYIIEEYDGNENVTWSETELHFV